MMPSGDAGDALQRLQDEQWHILALFDSYERHRRNPAPRLDDAGRLAEVIGTLLRVHCELQTVLLRAAGVREDAALARAGDKRRTMLQALDDVQTLSPHDSAHARRMTELAQCTREWFEASEQEVHGRLRRSRVDLGALDHELALRQQALLAKRGRSAGGHSLSL